MDINEVYAEVEAELSWRQGEIRFFQNLYSKGLTVEEQKQCRRSLILFLYAHFEGFCKFCFTIYVNTINKEKILCKDIKPALAALTLSTIFQELRNPDKKSPIFNRQLPDETKLHKFAREVEFLERVNLFESNIVTIPEHVIDTESNLKPIVLQKNLFRLGFDHNALKSIDGSIHTLLEYRNGISHGQMKDGIEQIKFEKIRDDTFTAMLTVRNTVYSSLSNGSYLK